MSYEVKGRLYKRFETVQVTEKFQKREFVLEVEDGAFHQHVKLQLIQDKCSYLDDLEEGTDVTVNFNLRGREWINKEGEKAYFTNLQAWRIESNSPAHTPERNIPATPSTSTDSLSPIKQKEEGDDLPF